MMASMTPSAVVPIGLSQRECREKPSAVCESAEMPSVVCGNAQRVCVREQSALGQPAGAWTICILYAHDPHRPPLGLRALCVHIIVRGTSGIRCEAISSLLSVSSLNTKCLLTAGIIRLV